MNQREFVCRAAIALLAGGTVYPNEDGWNGAWRRAIELWAARPQWMKDEDRLAEDAKQGYFKGKLIARLTPEQRREYDDFVGNMLGEA